MYLTSCYCIVFLLFPQTNSEVVISANIDEVRSMARKIFAGNFFADKLSTFVQDITDQLIPEDNQNPTEKQYKIEVKYVDDPDRHRERPHRLPEREYGRSIEKTNENYQTPVRISHSQHTSNSPQHDSVINEQDYKKQKRFKTKSNQHRKDERVKEMERQISVNNFEKYFNRDTFQKYKNEDLLVQKPPEVATPIKKSEFKLDRNLNFDQPKNIPNVGEVKENDFGSVFKNYVTKEDAKNDFEMYDNKHNKAPNFLATSGPVGLVKMGNFAKKPIQGSNEFSD